MIFKYTEILTPLDYLSLAEAKEHLRLVGIDDQDSYIESLIYASFNAIESHLGFKVVKSNFILETNENVINTRVNSITELAYRNNGYQITTDASSAVYHNYINFTINNLTLDGLGYNFRVKGTAGIEVADLSPLIKHAVRLCLHDFYENGGDMAPVSMYNISNGIKSLLFNLCLKVFI